jgi:hypothetical protein
LPETTVTGEPRRRFLARVGATLAAGLGITALGATSAGARAGREDADRNHGTNACAIYCYTYSCPGGCATGRNLFRCVDQCSGTWYYCLQHSCSSFCYSTSAC